MYCPLLEKKILLKKIDSKKLIKIGVFLSQISIWRSLILVCRKKFLCQMRRENQKV